MPKTSQLQAPPIFVFIARIVACILGIMTAACKFYLQGRCQRGKDCKYSHTAPPIPTATAIQQPPTVPEFIPDTVTGSWGDGAKVTFGEGGLPVHLDLNHPAGVVPRVQSLVNSIRVTWYQPTCPAWLGFDSEKKAERAVAKLTGMHLEGAVLSARLAGTRKDPGLWTVNVTGLNSTIRRSQMMDPAVCGSVPKTAYCGPFNYSPNVSGLEEVRKQLIELTSSRILEEREHPKEHPEKAARFFIFDRSVNLENVANAMDNRPLLALGNSRIYADSCLSLRLSVNRKPYSLRKENVKALAADVWTKYKVRLRPWVCPSDNHYVIIHMYGPNRDMLTCAKSRLDDLFARDLTLQSDLGKAKKQTHRLRLTKTTAYKEAKDAIEGAQSVFGKVVLSLDDESDPPAIVVAGDARTLRRVQAYFSKQVPKSKTIKCPICLDDEAEDFVRTDGCRHAACAECMIKFCTTKPTEESAKFPLKCFHPGCDSKLSIPWMHSLLSKEQMEEILTEALHDHLKRHPDEYAQCPGPKCSTMFQKLEGPNTCRLCEQCLIDYCGRCNVEYHAGMSCDDYQTHVVADEEDLRRWMEESGAKRCPVCSTVLQKTEDSCNNMDCYACRAHFCWICMETATSHNRVYQHLMEKHGGYFDNGADEWQNVLANMGPQEAALNGLLGDDVPQPPALREQDQVRHMQAANEAAANNLLGRHFHVRQGLRDQGVPEDQQLHQLEGALQEMDINIAGRQRRRPAQRPANAAEQAAQFQQGFRQQLEDARARERQPLDEARAQVNQGEARPPQEERPPPDRRGMGFGEFMRQRQAAMAEEAQPPEQQPAAMPMQPRGLQDLQGFQDLFAWQLRAARAERELRAQRDPERRLRPGLMGPPGLIQQPVADANPHHAAPPAPQAPIAPPVPPPNPPVPPRRAGDPLVLRPNIARDMRRPNIAQDHGPPPPAPQQHVGDVAREEQLERLRRMREG